MGNDRSPRATDNETSDRPILESLQSFTFTKETDVADVADFSDVSDDTGYRWQPVQKIKRFFFTSV